MQVRHTTLFWLGGTLVALCACEPKGEGVAACEEPLDTTAACCQGDYLRTTVSQLAGDPAANLGRAVEVSGIADWYHDSRQGSDCVCTASMCSCLTPLALRSSVCLESVPLSGSYNGRAVQCANDGCWPLVPGSRYALCGRLEQDDTASLSAPFVLQLDGFCPR